MKLTPEQREAVQRPSDLMLSACPGSGKTRVIISKLLRVLDELRGTPRDVACITYTNTAVHEIEGRIRARMQPDDERHVEVCTIHAFCLNSIFRPFHHLISGFEGGFKVLTPESEAFEGHVHTVLENSGRLGAIRQQDIDDFASINVTLDGKPIGNGIEHGGITTDLARAFWKRLHTAGAIDFPNIIYQSLHLLRTHPHVLSALCSRFSWILVDEFQDTSDLQVEILKLVASGGRTRFLLVGDQYQSIFGFTGARPDLADAFAAHIKADTDVVLSGNFRSSKRIVAHAEKVFGRKPPMEALGDVKDFAREPEWIHGTDPYDVVKNHFLPTLQNLGIEPGDAAVLAPDWFVLFPLARKLRGDGIQVVGPGARPYRRGEFPLIAEALCGYLMEPSPKGLLQIERTLFNALLSITGKAHHEIFSYEGRTLIFRLIAQSKELKATKPDAVGWLKAAAALFTKELIASEFLPASHANAFPVAVNAMLADIVKNKLDPATLSTDDLGVYASPTAALKLSTIHNAKGREFSAVALIKLQEGALPSRYATTAAAQEEQKRLFYVGLTRAQRYLLYATDDYTGRYTAPSRFLSTPGLNVKAKRA